MVTICPYDPVKDVFREQPYCCLNVKLVSLLKSEASLKEKLLCGLNVAFDSEVTKSCDKIIDIMVTKNL